MRRHVPIKHYLKNAAADIAALAVAAAGIYSLSAGELRIRQRLDNSYEDIMLPPLNDTEAEVVININEASVHQLRRLKGIGEAKAQAIVAYREEHGAFSSPEELINVSGIGEKTLEGFIGRITV